MEDQTFRSRLVELMKKSRKAVRLYGTVNKDSRDPGFRFSEAQADQWREVNLELLRQLSGALEYPKGRQLTSDIFAVRDRFHRMWKDAEDELSQKQTSLVAASKNGDFIKAALLSSDLVVIKARSQACQAVHHELNSVIKKSRVSLPTIELSKSQIVEERDSKASYRKGKVIPLRRKNFS